MPSSPAGILCSHGMKIAPLKVRHNDSEIIHAPLPDAKVVKGFRIR
jgi:hypothetical protein